MWIISNIHIGKNFKPKSLLGSEVLFLMINWWISSSELLPVLHQSRRLKYKADSNFQYFDAFASRVFKHSVRSVHLKNLKKLVRMEKNQKCHLLSFSLRFYAIKDSGTVVHFFVHKLETFRINSNSAFE